FGQELVGMDWVRAVGGPHSRINRIDYHCCSGVIATATFGMEGFQVNNLTGSQMDWHRAVTSDLAGWVVNWRSAASALRVRLPRLTLRPVYGAAPIRVMLVLMLVQWVVL